jgi:transposase
LNQSSQLPKPLEIWVNHNTLHGWIEKYSDSNQVNQKNMNSNKATCFEENKRLKKELALVKQERDLLKKAAAYLPSNLSAEV